MTGYQAQTTHEMLVDEFLPLYDVSDSVATVVDADISTTWNALMEVDLIDVGRKHRLVAVLGALRALPDLVAQAVRGTLPKRPPAKMRLREMTNDPPERGGWILLGEHPRAEIALGLVGKFWRPVIEFVAVGVEDFRDFATPGYAKTVYSLCVREIDGRRTLLSGTMRTATTDEHARHWFQRYWTLGVGSGAHVLVNGVLSVTRDMAEARAGTRLVTA